MIFELFLSGRYFFSKKRHAFISLTTFFSIGGVIVGVTALIIVISVMAGFEKDLKNRILGIESHIRIGGLAGRISGYRVIVDKVARIKGVKSAVPFTEAEIMLKTEKEMAACRLMGIDPLTAYKAIPGIDENSFMQLSANPDGIILGLQLASRLRAWEGTSLYLVSPKGTLSPMGFLPALKKHMVSGIFHSGMYQYDTALGFVRLETAKRFLRMKKDEVTGIDLRVEDIYQAEQIRKKIEDMLGPDYIVKDWMQTNQNLLYALKLEKTMMFIILTLILLVAALNIASTLIMMVMEKKRDIAILKAIGATGKSISAIFMLSGLYVGFMGTVFGTAFGILACYFLSRYEIVKLPASMYFVSKLPVEMHYPDIMVIGVCALIICFCATLYPAYQASRQAPVEAIRYE